MTTEEHTSMTIWQRMWPLVPAVAAVCFFISGWVTLGEKSLWIDEMRTGYATLSRSALHMGLLRYIMLNDPVGPLYALLVAGFCRVFGASDAMLRLPSLIFASLSVAAMGLLARRFLTAGAALAAVLFYMFSMNTLYFAQEARPYALLLFWSLLTYLLILAPPRNACRSTLLLSLTFVTGMYLHIVFAFVIANCLLHELFFATRERATNGNRAPATPGLLKRVSASPVARGALAAGLAYLPWFIILLTRSADPARTPDLTPSLGKSLIAAVGGLLVGNAYTRMQIVSMAVASALALWAYGMIRFHTHRPAGRRIVLVWTLAPVALTLAALGLFRNVYNFFHFRYLLPVMPFLLLPMASGLAVFVDQNILGLFRRKNETWPERVADLWLRPAALIRFVYIFIVLVFLFCNTANRIAYGNSEQQNWRDAYSFLKQSVQSGDPVILHGIAAPAIEYYALRDPHPISFIKTNDLSEITSRTQSMGNKWIVTYKDHWHPEFFKTSRPWLDALFQPQSDFEGVQGDIGIASNRGITLTTKRTLCFSISTQTNPERNSGARDRFSCLLSEPDPSGAARTDTRRGTCTTHFTLTLPANQTLRISIPRQETGDLSFWAQDQGKLFHVSFQNQGETNLRLNKDLYSVGFYLDFQEQPQRMNDIIKNPRDFPPLCITLEPDRPIQIPNVADELAYGKYFMNWIRK